MRIFAPTFAGSIVNGERTIAIDFSSAGLREGVRRLAVVDIHPMSIGGWSSTLALAFSPAGVSDALMICPRRLARSDVSIAVLMKLPRSFRRSESVEDFEA